MRLTRWLAVALVAGLTTGATVPLGAQGSAPAAAETLEVGDEVRALVAPVALFPDPLLAVVLQASMFPVDVVQAERFLDRYAQDPSLQPSSDWDPAVVALLDHADLVREMSAHLDWTQALGDAVADELEAVQDAIQDLRKAAYAMGMLASNEVQTVTFDDGFILIEPAVADRIAVPRYDGAALVAALEALPEDPAPVDAAAAAAPPAALGASVAAEPPPPEPPPPEPATTAAAPAEPAPVEPAVAVSEPAYVDPAAYAPAAAPSYATAPVYAAPPPPVAYSEPTSSFWSSGTATFLGGAAVGGILGYVLADDGGNGGGGGRKNSDNINIKDSTIILGDRYRDDDRYRRKDRDRVQADLRDRRDRRGRDRDRETRGDRDRPVAALPITRDRPRGVAPIGKRDGERRRVPRDLALPQRDRDRPVRAQGKAPERPALKAPKPPRGAIAAIKPPSETRKAALRGATSRDKAAKLHKVSAPAQRAERSAGGKRYALLPTGGGREAKGQGDRGKQSRGDKRKNKR